MPKLVLSTLIITSMVASHLHSEGTVSPATEIELESDKTVSEESEIPADREIPLENDLTNSTSTVQDEMDNTQVMPDGVDETESLYSAPKEVKKASPDAKRAANTRKWTNIALAVGAVIVAAIAMIVVSKNKGHHKSESGHSKHDK